MLKHLLTWRIRHLLYGQPTCSHAVRCQAVCHLHTDCSGPPCPTEPLFPSHTQLPNFQSIRVECFKHSLIDPFNGAHRPEQTHSFMGFQKCKWSIFLTLSQGFLATGLRPAAAGLSLTRVTQGTTYMFSVSWLIEKLESLLKRFWLWATALM